MRSLKVKARTSVEGSRTEGHRKKRSEIGKAYDFSGERNPNYKRGYQYTKDGYRLMLYPDRHPFKGKRKYMLEHRLVMEKYLNENDPNHPALVEVKGYDGKYLSNKWEVHHKNEDRLNNDPSNLKALLPGDHRREHMVGKLVRQDITYEQIKPLLDDGISRERIAKILNCDPGTVKRRIAANHK